MHHHDSLTAQEHFTNLLQFRQAAYALLGPARDALFELADADLQLAHLHSFVELSCAPAFHRTWSSAYAAVQDGRPNRTGLLQLYVRHAPPAARLILVGDHTPWTRLWAPTLAGRSYQHQSTPIPGRRPVTIGHGYSTIALIPERVGSWALPLLHERITNQKPVSQAAQQLDRVCQQLDQRPVSLWDSEYGCAAFLSATAGVPADKLLRLRTNLSLEGPTKPYAGRGRYPTHGIPFKFQDPATWWPPDQVLTDQDPELGPLVVRIWQGLRFSKALDCPMRIAQIERVQAPGTRRKPKILWLAWVGQAPPEHWWRLYARRYPIEHWYRFAKGRLHWTLPRFATPQQGERWSDLMPLLTWELWLARPVAQDRPLPWQKPQARPAPGRVCQSMGPILAQIGTPTRVCKPRGKSPGWQTGRPRAKRDRHELIRSQQWQTIRAHQKAKSGLVPPKRGRPKKNQSLTAA